MQTNIQTLEYPGLLCLIYRHDDITYVNVSKWARNCRDFTHWIRLSLAKSKIEKAKSELGLDDVIIRIGNVKNEYRGVYVYTKLAISIASWIDSDFGDYVSSIFSSGSNDTVKDEIINQISKEIKQKDMQINILSSKYQNQKKALRDKTEHIQMLQDALKQLSTNTVPSDSWNRFAVFKIYEHTESAPIQSVAVGLSDQRTTSEISPLLPAVVSPRSFYYKAIRCRRDKYEHYCRYNVPIDAINIYNTDLPNGIEYFSTFRDEYARNHTHNRNIVNTLYNDITLKPGINEHTFVETLHQHRSRIEAIVNAIILNESILLDSRE